MIFPMLLLLSLFCDFPVTIQEGLIPKVNGLKVFHAYTRWKRGKLFAHLSALQPPREVAPNYSLPAPNSSVWGRSMWPQAALPPCCVAIVRMPFIDQTCLESCTSPACCWAPQGAVGRQQCLSRPRLNPSSALSPSLDTWRLPTKAPNASL